MLHRFLPLSSSLPPHLLSSPSPRRLQQMEFVQGVFGGGFVPDTAAKIDDCGGGDDSFVDELLDFSNGFSDTEEQQPPPQPEETPLVSPEKQAAPPLEDELESLNESKLVVQAEGLESLEWLSHFVEDSFSDYSLTGKPHPKAAAEEMTEKPCFTTPVQTKARTKRARTGVRVWPVLSPSRTEPSATSSSSSTSSTTSFCPKRKKSKTADEGGGGGGGRRCSHCGVTKTPQWRAGPEGSKTLCNACGVRFKSGRLLPEYRPACSPTFSSELHSNNHRKVLEMRRKKEDRTGETGLPFPVRSF